MLFIVSIIAFLLYVILAPFGYQLFIHKFYVNKLLKLFECQEQNKNEQKPDKKCQRKYLSSQLSMDSFTSDLSLDSDYSTDDDATFDSDDLEMDQVPENFRSNMTMCQKLKETRQDLDMGTALDLAKLGIQAIVDDEVTKRFTATELKTWNLLTRTDRLSNYKSFKMVSIWLIGLLFRYSILLPFRLTMATTGTMLLFSSLSLIGLLPESQLKSKLYRHALISCSRVFARGLYIVTYHNPENKAKPGGVCVANHTSPIDIVTLILDNAYALVGQRHNGYIGWIERAMSAGAEHIWFDRSQINDRQAVARRLREHINSKRSLPILIFPEGTCINNSAVMMFKKGSFEIGAPIYPVAIKYDARFADPYWDSSRYGFLRYLLMLMTSWAMVCDVWYLPPMTRRDGEGSIEFANRVKAKIASRGGLVDLQWDGQLKRLPVKPEMVKQQQLKFSQTLIIPNKDNNDNFIYTQVQN